MGIPFHVPVYDERDQQALAAALRSGRLVGDGEQTRRACERLAELLGVPHVLLTTSCTHALELAMLAIDLQPGDEVIVPSFTFVSSANCVLRAGGRVVFADIREDTLTLDANSVADRLSPRTRAVMPVVYAGVSPELSSISAALQGRPIPLIEDAAQGIGASYRGQPAGTIGDIGCFSFHETKNISTGEGGAFVTRREDLMRRAEIIREKGTNRKQFLQGLVDKYTWVDVGSSFLPPDFTGALLLSQLAKMAALQARREVLYRNYLEALAPLAAEGRLRLPVIPSEAVSNYHLLHVLFENETTRNEAIDFLRARGISSAFHYLPLHCSPAGKALGCKPGDCPVTESVSGRLLRLPLYPGLTEQQQEVITAAVFAFFKR